MCFRSMRANLLEQLLFGVRLERRGAAGHHITASQSVGYVLLVESFTIQPWQGRDASSEAHRPPSRTPAVQDADLREYRTQLSDGPLDCGSAQSGEDAHRVRFVPGVRSRNRWREACFGGSTLTGSCRRGVTPLERQSHVEATGAAGGEVRWHREFPSPAHLGTAGWR